MLVVYIQTYCPTREKEGQPTWTNPFLASIRGIYTQSNGGQIRARVISPTTVASTNPDVAVQSYPTEKALLQDFWQQLKSGPPETFVTFNGRTFTVPFLLIRSALNEVLPTQAGLLRDRYKLSNHHDLADLLTFHGIIQKPSLLQLAVLLQHPTPIIQEGDALQNLMASASSSKIPEILTHLVNSGCAYVSLIHRVQRCWEKFLFPVQ